MIVLLHTSRCAVEYAMLVVRASSKHLITLGSLDVRSRSWAEIAELKLFRYWCNVLHMWSVREVAASP